jgi:hypothetical protein
MNSLTYVNNQGKKENKGSFFKKVFKWWT